MGPELIILCSTLVFSAAGWLVLSRMTECPKAVGTIDTRSLSIIVPARNEEHNLPVLLSSIRTQSHTPCEIIVVNDHSTDRTVAVAQEFGANVYDAAPLPAGWQGKTWACWHGAAASRGDLLMFLDADTWFEANGLVSTLARYRGGAMSICPYHVVKTFSETMSLFFNLNMAAANAPSGLFGQMLLVDRESYFRVEGHQSVKGKVLENVYMAAVFRANGIATTSMIGRGVLSFRMYPGGLNELVPGWTKGFVTGAAQVPVVTLACLVAWMAGLLSPLSLLCLSHDVWISLAAYAACTAQVVWFGRYVGSFGWQTALVYPLPLLAFFGIFLRALLSPHRLDAWKGRTIGGD